MLTIRVEHVLLPSPEQTDLLERVAVALESLVERIGTMQEQLDDLKAAVAAQTDVVASAVTAFQGLADKIEQSADDPDEVRDLAATVRQNSQALAAAIPQNTQPGALPGVNPPPEPGTIVPPGGAEPAGGAGAGGAAPNP